MTRSRARPIVATSSQIIRLILFVLISCSAAASGKHAELQNRTKSRSRPEEVHIAVSSNFVPTMRALAKAYERETGYSTRISSASTGKLDAQIRNGAPFDVFLAADGARPERLASEGIGVRETLQTYAVGRLVLVNHVRTPNSRHSAETEPPEPSSTVEGAAARAEHAACDKSFFSAMTEIRSDPVVSAHIRHIAIANPRTAPYGLAAQQALEMVGAWTDLQKKFVRGENVSQTLQFIESGNAQAGFISISQLQAYSGKNLSACHWIVPTSLHSPIAQKMVVLERSAEKRSVRAFSSFLAGPIAKSIIIEFGYTLETL